MECINKFREKKVNCICIDSTLFRIDSSFSSTLRFTYVIFSIAICDETFWCCVALPLFSVILQINPIACQSVGSRQRCYDEWVWTLLFSLKFTNVHHLCFMNSLYYSTNSGIFRAQSHRLEASSKTWPTLQPFRFGCSASMHTLKYWQSSGFAFSTTLAHMWTLEPFGVKCTKNDSTLKNAIQTNVYPIWHAK